MLDSTANLLQEKARATISVAPTVIQSGISTAALRAGVALTPKELYATCALEQDFSILGGEPPIDAQNLRSLSTDGSILPTKANAENGSVMRSTGDISTLLKASYYARCDVCNTACNGQIVQSMGASTGAAGTFFCSGCESSVIRALTDLGSRSSMVPVQRNERDYSTTSAALLSPLSARELGKEKVFSLRSAPNKESDRLSPTKSAAMLSNESDLDVPLLVDENSKENEERSIVGGDTGATEARGVFQIISSSTSEVESDPAPSHEGFVAKTRMETTGLSINITPLHEKPFLSDYNLLVTKNVEFFQLSTKDGNDKVVSTKVGLRCTNCSKLPVHYTAASFFPSAVGSVASGLGTIAARHFLGGKCPLLPKFILDQLSATKKSSTIQTKTPGHIGMEAYMRNICARHSLVNSLGGGIQFRSMEDGLKLIKTENEVQFNTAKAEKILPDQLELSNGAEWKQSDGGANKGAAAKSTMACADKSDLSFRRTTIDHFWECTRCTSVPLYWRARGSVVFSFGQPAPETVAKHLSACKGVERLVVPRKLSATSICNENPCIVRIKWDSKCTDEWSDIEESASRGYPNNENSLVFGSLVLPEQKSSTTDFAFFAMQQLLKCYLTKSGGSRGTLPVGYPVRYTLISFVTKDSQPSSKTNISFLVIVDKGLACKHCAREPNGRRFFYTSADHLRNSFSHIPSHLMECSKCTVEIKAALVAFREMRNSQKSLLKPGSHKIFIESIWARIHRKGKDHPIILAESEKTSNHSLERLTSEVHEGERAAYRKIKRPASVSAEGVGTYQRKSAPKKLKVEEPMDRSCIASGMQPSLESGRLCNPEEKRLTTDFTFFTTSQLLKCCLERGVGSRPSCAIGFPGLACKHCFGKDGERRFFYTSADHLRNSFSHIPTHLMQCKHCPSNVKDELAALKETRHRQKSLLRPGSHKSFINQVWNRVHVEKDAEDQEMDMNTALQQDQELSLQSETGINTTSEQDQNSSFQAEAQKKITDARDNSATSDGCFNPFDVILSNEREMTSSYAAFSFQQFKLCHLTEEDTERGDFSVGYPGLVCMHCETDPNAKKFFYRSCSQLYSGFEAIPNHLCVCCKTPKDVKDVLSTLKKERPSEDAKLKRGMHRQFIERIWSCLISLDGTGKSALPAESCTELQSSVSRKIPAMQPLPLAHTTTMENTTISSSAPIPTVVPSIKPISALLGSAPEASASLVTEADKTLVTEFTFLTFQQVTSCSLNATGNGSRSSFDVGFPGLACKHCSLQPNGRSFFYRTADILAANHAHIPNHLFCCSKVPENLRRELEKKKDLHSTQKKKLQRGSQKDFFNRIMQRMQENIARATSVMMESGEDLETDLIQNEM